RTDRRTTTASRTAPRSPPRSASRPSGACHPGGGSTQPAPLDARGGGGALAGGPAAGDGEPTLLQHGLTATRRYVVHGSRVLERAGHPVGAYEAPGQRGSPPRWPPEA